MDLLLHWVVKKRVVGCMNGYIIIMERDGIGELGFSCLLYQTLDGFLQFATKISNES
jgi:hypothetical protein